MITIEELRKVYSETFEGAIVAQESQAEAFDAALLALARYVEKKVREQEPTKEMRLAANRAFGSDGFSYHAVKIDIAVIGYRAMQSVAPSVVPE